MGMVSKVKHEIKTQTKGKTTKIIYQHNDQYYHDNVVQHTTKPTSTLSHHFSPSSHSFSSPNHSPSSPSSYTSSYTLSSHSPFPPIILHYHGGGVSHSSSRLRLASLFPF